MILTTPRLILRPWRDEDLAPFAAMAADRDVMGAYPGPMDRSDSVALIEQFQAIEARNGLCYAAIERAADGAFLGLAGLAHGSLPWGDFIEIGWALAAPHQGHGYAAEAARAWLAHGFDTLGLREILAFAMPGNTRSTRLMARLGLAPDPARDFDHPDMPEGHPGRRRLVHALTRDDWHARCSRPTA